MCPICGGCGLNQWKTVEVHVKKCAAAQPNMAERNVMPGEPHWRKSDPPLKNHTRAVAMETMYTLMHQMMGRLHIEAKSFNVFERNGESRSTAEEKLLQQQLLKLTKMMRVKLKKVTTSRPNRSLNK